MATTIKLKNNEAALIITEDLHMQLALPNQKDFEPVSDAGYVAAILGYVFGDKKLFEAARKAFDRLVEKNDKAAMKKRTK